MIFRYTVYGLVAAAVLFAATQYFARPAPRTMTKEWQEAQNEYLKVRLYSHHDVLQYGFGATRDLQNAITDKPRTTGEQDRAYHWCQLGRLQGPWYGAERAGTKGVDLERSVVDAKGSGLLPNSCLVKLTQPLNWRQEEGKHVWYGMLLEFRHCTNDQVAGRNTAPTRYLPRVLEPGLYGNVSR